MSRNDCGTLPRTLYICNRQRGCKKSSWCYYNNKTDEETCKYTSGRVFAKNGPCDDPWNHPERFKKDVFNSDTIVYVEKEN